MLRVYGDSFSYKYWMEEEDTYAYKLSQILQTPYINTAFPALCNHEIFQRLLNDMDSLQEGDLIVYQFSAYAREGYMFDNNFYYSTAGLRPTLEETIEIMNKWGGGRDKYDIEDEDIINLYEYISKWADKTVHFKWHRVDSLLKFLEKEKGIKYLYMFLDDGFDKYQNHHCVQFPYPGKSDLKAGNLAIIHWAWHNELTIHHANVPGSPKWDCHPSATGHTEIAIKIKDLYDTIY